MAWFRDELPTLAWFLDKTAREPTLELNQQERLSDD